MDKSSIKVLLNNNPVCEVTFGSIIKEEVWHVKNKPYILIEGDNFENGDVKIVVLYNEQELHDEVIVNNNSFILKMELINPLNDNVRQIDVFVDKQRFVIPICLKKLFGTVKYFNGQPVKNPIINCTIEEDISVVGDENGNFEIALPEGVRQIGVFDKSYSQSTLEAWLYNVHIKEDTGLDIRIDKAEVYGITMWKQYCSDYIHFIPMSLTRTERLMDEGIKGELELSYCNDINPRLSRGDVQVFLGGKEVEVLSFCEVDDFIGYKDGEKVNRTGYVLSIPKVKDKDGIIKIVINSRYLINGQEIVDKGEGYYFFAS